MATETRGARASPHVQLKSEEVVCRKGEVGNKMYIVSEGMLNVESPEVQPIIRAVHMKRIAQTTLGEES